jgi:hypothetical protein
LRERRKKERQQGGTPATFIALRKRSTIVSEPKAQTDRKRKPVKPAKTPLITGSKKVSANLPLEDHRKLSMAASMTGRRREDIILDAIRDACSWVVISDRRTPAVPDANDDRPREADGVKLPDEKAA